jgi:hypothetical protein
MDRRDRVRFTPARLRFDDERRLAVPAGWLFYGAPRARPPASARQPSSENFAGNIIRSGLHTAQTASCRIQLNGGPVVNWAREDTRAAALQ